MCRSGRLELTLVRDGAFVLLWDLCHALVVARCLVFAVRHECVDEGLHVEIVVRLCAGYSTHAALYTVSIIDLSSGLFIFERRSGLLCDAAPPMRCLGSAFRTGRHERSPRTNTALTP